MKSDLCASLLAAALAFLLGADCRGDLGEPPGIRQVTIDYFFEPGCDECFRISDEVLPGLASVYDGFYALREWDLGNRTNYFRLVALMEELGVTRNARVFMALNGRKLLVGLDDIRANLHSELDIAIADPPFVAGGDPLPSPQSGKTAVEKRFGAFTLAGVMAAGLLDGINPCAISTLIFLISVLSLSRVSGGNLVLVGVMFCMASFVTYTAIGLGLLRAIYALDHFRHVRLAGDFVLLAILLILAAYSFRDAFRFRSSGKTGDVSVKLPGRMQDLIHRIVRAGFRNRSAQAASAMGIGSAVTALESVCTGQVYVPTLVIVARSGLASSRGYSLLIAYNAMFVVPLALTFVLTWQGLEIAKLVRWGNRNVVVSKILLGLFFVATAALLLVLM